METLKHYALYQIMGMPAWSFALFVVLIPALNEIVMRSKNVKAMSFLQALVNFVRGIPVLSSIPVVKQILDALATKPAPAILPPDNASQR